MTKVSALQGEFQMMILLIPSLITNEGDQHIIIHVAIHENAYFSKRAADMTQNILALQTMQTVLNKMRQLGYR